MHTYQSEMIILLVKEYDGKADLMSPISQRIFKRLFNSFNKIKGTYSILESGHIFLLTNEETLMVIPAPNGFYFTNRFEV